MRDAAADPRQGRQPIIGVAVYCAKCGRRKAPFGRSVPITGWDSLCTPDSRCAGHEADPCVGDLWPGETSWEFPWARVIGARPMRLDEIEKVAREENDDA